MTAIPEPEHTTINAIDKAHEGRQSKPRSHMGVSQLGQPCDRRLWLTFRWAVQEQHNGRMLRLFRRGQNEEASIIADLRATGVDIQQTTDRQSYVDFGAHVGGSPDGVIESGLIEAPKKRHIAEFKTHSKKSFDDLIKKGDLKQAKPEHWAQVQVYMHGKDIDRTAYIAICKDDDRMYLERIRLDKDAAAKLVERGQRIATDERMPEPISGDPTYYICKMCPAHSFCHGNHTAQEANCRTCAHSTPTDDGRWHCAFWDDYIPTEFQRHGCDNHVLHPDTVPWEIRDSESEWEAVYIVNGQPVVNGNPEGREGVYASSELIANAHGCTDDGVNEIRERFSGRVVG